MKIQIITTADKKETMEKIAKTLVEEKLAACAQILGPIKSIYWWEGKVVEDEEFICIIKSKADLYGEIEKRIREIHPYEVPEIIGTVLDFVSKDYEDWLEAHTK